MTLDSQPFLCSQHSSIDRQSLHIQMTKQTELSRVEHKYFTNLLLVSTTHGIETKITFQTTFQQHNLFEPTLASSQQC